MLCQNLNFHQNDQIVIHCVIFIWHKANIWQQIPNIYFTDQPKQYKIWLARPVLASPVQNL